LKGAKHKYWVKIFTFWQAISSSFSSNPLLHMGENDRFCVELQDIPGTRSCARLLPDKSLLRRKPSIEAPSTFQPIPAESQRWIWA
jgi:hypothetical protein